MRLAEVVPNKQSKNNQTKKQAEQERTNPLMNQPAIQRSDPPTCLPTHTPNQPEIHPPTRIYIHIPTFTYIRACIHTYIHQLKHLRLVGDRRSPCLHKARDDDLRLAILSAAEILDRCVRGEGACSASTCKPFGLVARCCPSLFCFSCFFVTPVVSIFHE